MMYAQASCVGTVMRPCMPCHALPARSMPSRQLRLVARASSSGSDPYSVLGVQPGADTNEINRAYTKLKYAARSNPTEYQRIENAHSAIMLAGLNSRLKGKSSVPKEIAYADTEVLFPWRPKRWDATPKVIMIVGAIQLAMLAFAFQQPSISKVVGCMLIGIVGNVMKQNAINPPPKDPNYATEEEQSIGGKNFVRATLLALLATFIGVALLSGPEYLLKKFGASVLPQLNVPSLLVSCKVASTAICNWIMTAYYY